MDLMRHSHNTKELVLPSSEQQKKRVIFFGYNVANLVLLIVLYGAQPNPPLSP